MQLEGRELEVSMQIWALEKKVASGWSDGSAVKVKRKR